MSKDIKLLRNENNMAPCKFCKRKKVISYPRIDCIDGMYYARCPNCSKSDPFDYLALSSRKCIEVWNRAMETKGFSETE